MARTTGEDEDLSRLLAAHHEAGHGVIHRVGGGRVRRLELFPAGGGRMTPVEDTPDPNAMLNWLAMILAGPEAGVRFLTDYGYSPSLARRTNRRRDRHDFAAFARYARGTGINESKARRHAEKLVRRHWSRIHRAALKLDRCGRLPGSSL